VTDASVTLTSGELGCGGATVLCGDDVQQAPRTRRLKGVFIGGS
jgi:hypothetical protein